MIQPAGQYVVNRDAKTEQWQWRNRGHKRWENIDKPDVLWLQMEYRVLDKDGNEIKVLTNS